MPPRKLSPNEIYGLRWIPFTLQTTFLPLSLSLSLSSIPSLPSSSTIRTYTYRACNSGNRVIGLLRYRDNPVYRSVVKSKHGEIEEKKKKKKKDALTFRFEALNGRYRIRMNIPRSDRRLVDTPNRAHHNFFHRFRPLSFTEFPRDRRTERCWSRARLIARRIKGTGKCDVEPFFSPHPPSLSSVLIFVRHFESSTRKLLPEVDGTQKRIHLFHEIIS